jgi:hypothetical protein
MFPTKIAILGYTLFLETSIVACEDPKRHRKFCEKESF